MYLDRDQIAKSEASNHPSRSYVLNDHRIKSKDLAQLQASINSNIDSNKQIKSKVLNASKGENQPIQMNRYFAQASKRGISASVSTVHEKGVIYLQDRTETDQNVGDLDGYVTYKIRGKEFCLDHIETHPPGFGLGSILMLELAQTAADLGFKIITISMPAQTAVGAYLHFGAHVIDESAYSMHFKALLERYSTDDEARNAKINLHKDENVKHRMETEKYFNPDMSDNEEEHLKVQFEQNAADKVGSANEEAQIHASLLAMSLAGLYFDVKELLSKSGAATTQKWKRMADFQIINDYVTQNE